MFRGREIERVDNCNYIVMKSWIFCVGGYNVILDKMCFNSMLFMIKNNCRICVNNYFWNFYKYNIKYVGKCMFW